MDKKILNVEEVCGLLDISIKLFKKIIKEEEIPARKIGREWRFSEQAIIDWIGNGNSKDFKVEIEDKKEKDK